MAINSHAAHSIVGGNVMAIDGHIVLTSIDATTAFMDGYDNIYR